VCGWGRVAATNVQTHLRPGFGNFTRSIEAGVGSFSFGYSLQLDDCIVLCFCWAVGVDWSLSLITQITKRAMVWILVDEKWELG